jgi:cell division protein FtsL
VESPSSTPPGYVKARIPEAVIWIVLGQAVLAAITIAGVWLHMHDQILTLELKIGGYEAKIDQLSSRMGTFEDKVFSCDTRIRIIEQGHR